MEEGKFFRQTGICRLRILATVAVVWIHTCATLLENSEIFNLPQRSRPFFEIGVRISTWAVPVFFMITGGLLLNPDKKITIRECLQKYVIRILLALFLFGVPFAFLKIVVETKSYALGGGNTGSDIRTKF